MTMHHERRSLYRVAPGRRDELRVTIEPARGAWPAQAVVDLNAQGLGAAFSHADTPDLEVGDRARIRITGPLPGAPFELDSVLAMRAEKGGRRHLGFRFEAGPLARGMAQECYRVFNRRSCYRATLPDDEPALVWPGNAPGTELALHVRDVSLAGMSAWTDAPGEDPLAQAGSLALSFRLPQRPRLFRFVATAQSRERHGGRMDYALVFDRHRTRHYLEQAEDLADFVMERYLEDFQGAAH